MNYLPPILVKVFWTLLLSLFVTASFANITTITDENSSKAIDVKILYLFDQSSAGINEILKEPFQQKFELHPSASLNFGFQSAALWLKISYQDKRTKPYSDDLLLEIASPLLDHIELYRPTESGFTLFTTGVKAPYQHREIDAPNFIFYLPHSPYEIVTVYIKVQTQSPLTIPLTIKSLHNSFTEGKLISDSNAYLMGLLLLIVSYTFLSTVSTNEIEQYYHLLWFTLATLCSGILTGVMLPHVGSYSTWFANNLWGFGSFTALFFLLHLSHYINLPAINPRLHKITLTILFGFFLNALLIFSTDLRLWGWTLLILSICGIIGPVIIGYAFFSRQRTVWFAVATFIPTLAGLLTYITSSAGLLQSNWLTLHAIFIGLTVTGVLKVLVEGDKLNEERNKSYTLELENSKALEANNQLLATTNAAKDAFLSTISHELRTPLNGASGAAALLIESTRSTAAQQNVDVPPDIKELFKVITKSINEIISLINSIINFSELHAENQPIHNNYFNPYSSIISLVEQHKSAINAQSNDLHLNIDSLIAIEVLSDEEKYKTVLGIVIENANKFTRNGCITLKGSIEKPDSEHVKLLISIADTGEGIPQSDIAKITEPFSQADHSFSRKHGGLGIGLAVCNKTMNLLGGELEITSEINKGTHVQLTFEISSFRSIPEIGHSNPVVDLESTDIEFKTTAPTKDPSGNNPYAGLKVLIVEDNKINQLITKKMLQKKGLHPIVAENGAVAVDLFRDNKIDIILMDCQMPIMDGFEATRHIRVLATNNDLLPIIAVTANSSNEDQRKCKQSGMDDFLAKPISYDTLCTIIEKWAKKKAEAKKASSA